MGLVDRAPNPPPAREPASRVTGAPGRCSRSDGSISPTASRVRPSESAGVSRPSDLLLEGFALAFTDGRAAAAPVLARAATGFAGPDVSVEEVLRWGWLATAAAAMVWDYETCRAVAMRGVETAREAGALSVLAVSVNVMTQAIVLGGEFGAASLLVSEADSVIQATGTHVAPYGALVHP